MLDLFAMGKRECSDVLIVNMYLSSVITLVPHRTNLARVFRLFLQVAMCPFGKCSHKWADCPYAHVSENAQRRDPGSYTQDLCPFFVTGSCLQGAHACWFIILRCILYLYLYYSLPYYCACVQADKRCCCISQSIASLSCRQKVL